MIKLFAIVAALSLAGPPHFAHCVQPTVTNHWLPFHAGTVYQYRGERNNRPVRDTVVVTHRHRTVDGVRTTVLWDRAWVRGHLIERTYDYYVQDCHGNVWYMGENTAELRPDGSVRSTEGSWIAGRHGAKPGIFMPAHPQKGDSGWQEYWKGHAEDRYTVLSKHASVNTTAASSNRSLLTRETSPLEPGVVDHKYYVRGVGDVKEVSVKGDNERLYLVRVTHPKTHAQDSQQNFFQGTLFFKTPASK